VQISQVSVQLTADTRINTQHYNLIDACSVLSLSPGCAGQIGGGEDGYLAEFDLHPGKMNTVIPATSFKGIQECGCPARGLTLQPGQVAKVTISYLASDNLIFSVRPSFILDWPGNQAIFVAPQLQATFAFASDSHFSCYTLQDQKFVGVPLDSMYSPTAWCI
jgi:hypothetical protein